MTAFDLLAPDYDNDFTHSIIGRTLRERVHHYLLGHFSSGDHILELGCGTGEDARHLAQHSIRVTATDASPAMLTIAQQKNAGNPALQFALLDLNQPQLEADSQVYDGVFSNFGALNCLSAWDPLARWLAEHIRSGGTAAFGIMAPYCLWEIGWHVAHLDWQVAFRRLRGESHFQPEGAAEAITIHYPSVRTLTAAFSPWFERISLRPLGLMLPPTALYPVVEKRPRLLRTLSVWDERLAEIPALANFADHYWIELRRR